MNLSVKSSHSWLSVATAVALLAAGTSGPAFALVTQTGDVNPPFAAASAVNLTGQQVFIGSTVAGVGQVGTVSVTGGGCSPRLNS